MVTVLSFYDNTVTTINKKKKFRKMQSANVQTPHVNVENSRDHKITTAWPNFNKEEKKKKHLTFLVIN